MARSQISLSMMLALVACVAVNFWLFRVGIFWGASGLYITKHVVIAALCQAAGVNRQPPAGVQADSPATPIPGVEPSAN